MLDMSRFAELDVIELDAEDIAQISLRRHPIQDWLREHFQAQAHSLDDCMTLPQPYMRALDSAKLVYSKGEGVYGRGYAEACLRISQEDPWFWTHFLGDPVMPGSQGLDGFAQVGALWGSVSRQVWGRARALSAQVEYNGQVFPFAERIFYRVDIKRFFKQRKHLIFDGHLAVNSPDNIIYRFGETQMGFFSYKELGLSSGQARDYYQPDWEKIKADCLSWIEAAQQYYDNES